MKFQLNKINTPFRKVWFLVLLAWTITNSLYAQTKVTDQLKDITIPSTTTSVYINIKGGDGGNANVNSSSSCKSRGGSGAKVKAVFQVGNGENEIPTGSTLRFVRGYRGETEDFGAVLAAGDAGGGGGGGTAVLYRKPGSTSNSDWVILAVAGGGGGSYSGMVAAKCVDTHHGKGGSAYTYGGDGSVKTSYDTKGGRQGDNGENFSSTSGGGAGYDSRPRKVTAEGDPAQKGYPAGGAGGHCPGCENGGRGFGGGGFAFYGPGGGGGYSGGGAGSIGGAGGGGSFVNLINTSFAITAGVNGGGNEAHGYMEYKYNPSEDLIATVSSGAKNIRSAVAIGKCVTNEDGINANRNNIYLYNCDQAPMYAQDWLFDGARIQWFSNDNLPRCMDVENHNTSDGTNVRIWDCMEHNEQRWVYDGITSQFRSYLDPSKCLDASLTNGSNVKLWSCSSSTHQQWTVAGATIVSNPGAIQDIVPVKNTSLALQSASGAHADSNVQLWTKDGSAEEKWVFDGQQIKYGPSRDLCMTLHAANTSNGTNVELHGCSDMDAKKWIYDGLTKQIHSVANPNKCMEVTNGNFAKGVNIQIADCENVMRQKFNLKPRL